MNCGNIVFLPAKFLSMDQRGEAPIYVFFLIIKGVQINQWGSVILCHSKSNIEIKKYSTPTEHTFYYRLNNIRPAVVAQWLSTCLIIPRSRVQVRPLQLTPGKKMAQNIYVNIRGMY
jgi:hypothetical protein